MATTLPAIRDKNKEAASLRANVQALTAELQQLRKKLAEAAGKLSVLEDKRRVIAEELADGKPQKSGSADIHAQISEAQMPVEILPKRVREKESALNQTRETLAPIDREIAIEAATEARRVRYQELEKQITAAAAHISEDVRRLVEDDFPLFDAAKDALTAEFIGGAMNAGPVGPEGQAARQLIHREMVAPQSGLASTRRHPNRNPEPAPTPEVTRVLPLDDSDGPSLAVTRRKRRIETWNALVRLVERRSVSL